MKNNTVSDIYCLVSQVEEVKGDRNSQEQLFSVKGNASFRLPRRRDYQNSDVFPPGCMGNSKLIDLDALNLVAKRRERLSYDEQERAMNILSRIHRGRKALRLKLEAKGSDSNNNNSANGANGSSPSTAGKFRLTVRKSQPDLSDLDYLLELIKSENALANCAGRGDSPPADGAMLTAVEFRFMNSILMKENAMRFFRSRLRGGSSPSLICRNPITGNGLEENLRVPKKRGFDSVLKFMAESDSQLAMPKEANP